MVRKVGDYLVSRKILGVGMQGKVVRVKHSETGEMFVAKITRFDEPDSKERFAKEVAVLEKLKHCQNVVSMKHSFQEKKVGITILERMPFDLMTLIENDVLSIEQRKKVFKLICLAVKSCHDNDVAHLDLKPENILVSKDYSMVKLCDFGNSEILPPHSMISCSSGTMAYSAPEIFSSPYVDGRKADMWSLGVLYHILLSYYFPYQYSSDLDLHSKVKNAQIVLHESISAKDCKLISKLLNRNQETRMDIQTLCNYQNRCITRGHSLKMFTKLMRRCNSFDV